MGRKTLAEGEPGGGEDDARGPESRKLDLSAAQVAGSSLATVAAALLASRLGVYGTILGAGLVSVVATAGGPVIQHAFRRTGDRLREGARPRGRQVPAAAGEEGPGAAPPGEFGEATVHGTRVRGWKRTAVASGVAFALAVGGLGTYEAFAGTSVSSGGGTLLSGGFRTAPDHRSSERESGPDSGGRDRQGERGGGQGEDGKDGKDGTGGTGGKDGTGGRSPGPGSGSSPTPSAPHGPDPTPTPSGSSRPDPSPTPSRHTPTASPGGGTGAPDTGGASAGE